MSEPNERLQFSIIRFVGSLREDGREKKIQQTLYQDVIDQIRLYKANNDGDGRISKKDASILFYLFEATLSEANHANDPAPIIECAWDFSEEIRQVLDVRS